MSDYNTFESNLSSPDDQSFGYQEGTRYHIPELLSTLRRVDITVPVHPKEGGANHAERHQKSLIAAMKSALKSLPKDEAAQLYWEFFEALHDDRVKMNAWTGEIWKDGVGKTATKRLLNRMEKALGAVSPLTTDQFNRKFEEFIEDRTYNPMRTELDQLNKQHPDDIPEWSKLAQVLFGLTDPLSQQMLEKWLVAAVSRAVTPGEQADNTLVLKGAQGIGKSTFFRILGGDYFLDLESSTDALEVKRQLLKSWVVELGELDGITRKKDVEELKAFLTKIKDTERGLYEKHQKDHPRHVVFGGSCNSDNIFHDPTGSRRFWVLDCGDRMIDTDFLRVNRGQILATAYRKFINGFQWWADREMTKQSEERNQQYQVVNEFQDQVAQLVAELSSAGAIAVKASDILTYGFGIPVQQHKANSNDKKVALVLKQLGLDKRRIGQIWYWMPLGASEVQTVTPAAIIAARDSLISSTIKSQTMTVELPKPETVDSTVDFQVTAPIPQD